MTRTTKAAASLVRSSAAEYLTFVAASGTGGVEALYAGGRVPRHPIQRLCCAASKYPHLLPRKLLVPDAPTLIQNNRTPIEMTDKNTRAVFGDYISVYDIQRTVDDGATVPIYYESRLAQVSLSEDHRAVIDDEFEKVTEHEEVNRRERLKSLWAALEAVVGDEKRLERIAEDIVRHYEQRTEAIAGKAMIVCMSRRICVVMYQAIRKLRPAWHGDEDDTGAIKVIMTGSAADEKDWQPHIRSRARLDALAKRFRNDKDPLRLVIVRDMWLTGFDAPSLHTRRQADAGPRTHAGDRPRQPRVRRQAGRPRGRLPGYRRMPPARPLQLH